MLNRSLSAFGSRIASNPLTKPRFAARYILAGAIVPASFSWVHTSSAADVLLPPNYTINSDLGAPVYNEGLIEGFLGRNLAGEFDADNETTANPNNSSPELTIRNGQLNPGDPPDPDGFADGWANNRTWIYTGQIQITTPFLAFAMNNDDTDWLKINGVIVLDDNQWDNPVQALSGGAGNNLNTASTGGDFNLVAGLGLTMGQWYDIEFRISDTGAGGAGPSGQGVGWNATYGVGMNTTGFMLDGVTPLDVSVNGADYIKPAEPAGGGPTLFRYLAGFGTDDNLRVQSTSTVTINGANAAVSVAGVRFENGATPATLTINDGTGTHKTFTTINGTTLATANNQAVSIGGTADFRPGVTSDGAFTGVTVTAVGPGALIFDAATGNDLNGTTIRAGTGGRVLVQGSGGNNPVNSLATPLTISGDGGLIGIGSPTGAGQTYNNALTATESGTLAHAGQGADILGSATKPIIVPVGKTLTVNNTGGTFTLAGPLTGAGTISKSGGGLVRSTSNASIAKFVNTAGTTQLAGPNTTLTDVSVTGGRLEVSGQFTLTNSPISTGGTLAIVGPITNNLPNPFVISGGTVEAIPSAITTGVGGAGGNSSISLTGGTLSISMLDFGLTGQFFNGDNAGALANFGAFDTYSTYFAGRGAPSAQALTSGGGTTELSFNPSGSDAQMYSQVTGGAYTAINNIVSRMLGKISISVEGNYTFGTTSDDGSMLFIDGQTVVNNNSEHGMARVGGSIFLTAGTHDIDIGFYENGGGNGLIVDWAGPGFAQRTLENRVLLPDLTPTTFDNPINVVENSGINVIAAGAIVPSLTMQPGKTLSTSGTQLTAPSIVLNGAGAYTFNASNTFLISNVNEGPAAVQIVKTGPGVVAFDNTSTPQFQNAADTITINQGLVGIVIQTGGSRPIGNAAVTMNGGGVLISSKGGNQNFNIPYTLAGDGAIVAGQTGSGVAGPITVTVSNPLNIPAGRTFTVGSRDNYTLVIDGTTTGTGTLAVNGGLVIANGNAADNVSILVNPLVGSATLNINKNSPTVASLASAGNGAANITFGTGTGTGTFTIAGTANGRYIGAITAATGTTANLVKNGTGAQTVVGPTTFSGVTLNDGTLEVSPDSIGTGLINIAKGTLQFIQRGLRLAIYDSDPNTTGAYGGLLTINQVKAHYAALDLLPTPPQVTNTAADGNTVIQYIDPTAAALNGAPFAIHGSTDVDTIEALFTGKLFITTPGDYKFSPRSDDGTTIFVDGALLVNNNVGQGITDPGEPPRDRTINLTAGYHDFAMTFNEGIGGAGMFVNITPPGESERLLKNSELFTADLTYANNVNLTGSATLDPRGGTVNLGGITQADLATLTANSGTVAFTGTTSTGSVLNYAGPGSILPGTIANPATAITINQAGPGNVVFNSTTAELTNANSVINVNGGSITSVGTPTVNPLGVARVNLNGGELRISSTTTDLTLTNPVTIQSSSAIAAGNFGGGAVDGPVTATLPGLSVAAGQVVSLRSQNNYTLNFSGAVTGAGDLAVTEGIVSFSGATTPNRLTVNGGLATVSGSLAPTAGAAVNAGGTLGFNPGTGNTATYSGGPLAVNGGTVRAQSGITDLSGAPMTFSTRTSSVVPNALLGRFLPVSAGPGNTEAGIAAISNAPAVQAPLTTALNFGPQGQGDGAFSTFFGGVDAGAFSTGFIGNFTAPATGAYQAQVGIVDDTAGFWIDLNQNGVFEQAGSAGSELISSQGCCQDGPIGTANLTAGQVYKIAIAVQDTGGGSSLAGRAALPGGGGVTTINPGDPAQAGLWSYTAFAGGGNLQVDAEAQLRMSSVTGATDINLVGNNALLRLSSAAATTSTVEVLRATGAAGEIGVVELGANNTLTAGQLNLPANATLSKTGPGTLNVTTQFLAAGSTLQIDGGVAALNGPSIGTGNTGAVLVNATGTLRITGAIDGAVNVAGGGRIEGAGRVGPLGSAGNVSPGVAATPVATLTSGDLSLGGGLLTLDLQSTSSYDKLAVTGTVTLQNNPQLAAVFTAGSIALGDTFFIINNDGTDPVTGEFSGATNSGLSGSPGFVVLNGQPFSVSYFGDSATSTFDTVGGNDIALRAVPEPQTWATVMSGIGALIGLQRFRRRR